MDGKIIDQLTSIIAEIGRDSATALVRITTPGSQRMAFFEEGRLVYLVSNDPRELLKGFLTQSGRLSAPVQRQAVDGLGTTQPLVTQILEGGLTDADRIRPWMEQYAFASIGRAFTEPEGTVKVMAGMKAEHPVRLDADANEVILGAVRSIDDHTFIADALGPLSMRAIPSPDYMDRLLAFPLSYEEGMIGSQLTTTMALEDMISVTGLPEHAATKALLALRLVGVLDSFEEHKDLTDTGRLRRREAAMESGVAVDAEAAAALLGIERPSGIEGGAVSMEELEQALYQAQTETGIPVGDDGVAPPKGRRGNTGQLNLMASAYVDMARDEAKARNFNGAVEYFERALEQRPNDMTISLELAHLLMTKTQTLGAAERLLVRICQANPYAGEPRIELAKIYRESGRHSQATEALADAERVDPDNPAVQAALGKGKGGMFSKLRFER